MPKFLKKIFQSHQRAIRGIIQVYTHQLSFRIQFWWGVIVVSQTFYWPLGEVKRLVLLLLVFLMLIIEIINSTFENLFDKIERRYSAGIGYLKDILAGAALLMALASALIGTLILWPYILEVIIFAAIQAALIVGLIYLSRWVRSLIKKA